MRTFNFGFFTCFIISNIYQDMMGKEKFLKWANDNWMDTSPYMWGFVWFLVFIFIVYKEFSESYYYECFK